MNTNTRSVSFVENLQLEISDSLFNESLLLADVDNDGDHELVVGQINGELSIFKGDSHRPWRTCHHLGMITCVGAGDLWNQGENLLFCITAEGWCHIFYVDAGSTEDIVEPVSSQLLPSNCKVVLLADVDGDGLLKLVTGHADRVVHVHKLEADNHRLQETATLAQPNKEPTEHKKNSTSDSGSQASKQDLPKDNTKEHQTETPQKKERKSSKPEEKDVITESEHKNEQEGLKRVTKPQKFGWRFVSLNSWTVSYQINSLVVFDVMTTRHLLASQPGGTYAVLMSSNLSQQDSSEEQIASSPSSSIFNGQLPVLWGRNKGIPTNLITLKCRDCAGSVAHSARAAELDQRYLALCNQDGHLIFIAGNKHHWSLRIDQGNYNVFALSKLDITGDGNEEIAVCSWDGITYIVDHLRNVVQFKFGENVMAFCAGHYAFTRGKNLPALVYVTSCNRVVVYYNAQLSLMVPANLDVKMKRKASQDKEARAALGTSVADTVNNNGLTQLYKQCFYGKQS